MFRVALVLIFAANGIVCAASQKSDPKTMDKVVTVTAKADKPAADGTQTVSITVKIDSPFHLYANPVGNQDLASAATSVTFTGADAVSIDYPKGKTVKDKTIGDYNTYEGEIKITAKIKRKAGATVEASLKGQACKEKLCLLPNTIKTKVEMP